VEQSTSDRHAGALKRLAALLERPGPLDVVTAGLLVASEEYPDLDIRSERLSVEALGQEASTRIEALSNPFARLDALRAYFFEELGFRGNDRDYYDPRNSFLNEVLRRRLGIPLSLSILYIEVARGAGLEARGVALPGHFVARIDDGGRRLLVDPYHDGAVITEEDCRQLVSRATGRPALYTPDLLEGTGPREMLGRLLRNLKRIYLAQEDYRRALAVVEKLRRVFPDEGAELRDRGFLLAHLDRHGAAVADLETYLSLHPHAPDANAVRGRVTWLRKRITELN
jgi:regulator of sirC expression with transglutaminase-like and TPR domain